MTSLDKTPVRRQRRFAYKATAASAAALVAAAGITISANNATAQDHAQEDWDLVWADEFDGAEGELPNQDDWQLNIGHSYPGGPDLWGTGEIAYHTDDPANVSLDGDGHLSITALRDDNGDWTSARIETLRDDFRAPEGGALRVEGSVQLPEVTGEEAEGYWPAFWALGSPYRGDYWNWPEIGEFDFMESVNGLDWVAGTLHCGIEPGGPCDEPIGIGQETDCVTGPCIGGGFHDFAFEWDESVSPTELRWYINGEQFHSIDESELPADVWADFTEHSGYFILINLAMGGGMPDAVAEKETPTEVTESGHSLLVDYVRVYTRDN